ncbi:hypothetical protein RHGRI_015558 [Rhododendron griersonianum]|uniref:Protein kinase domain-containing protein n=1 Tax=Rhododendron griersonianum TaxID=479676 RepID=A0AAV6KEN1_9ERIC|nr:hypothetical protein RHGRI_015558 [Rhododendron griersonianum]
MAYRRRLNFKSLEEWELDCPHRFKYKDLHVATKGFKESELLGTGGFGAVYKGALPTTGEEIAVKKIMSNNSVQGMREFAAEIECLGRLRHKNLVNLQGWCKRKNDLLLDDDTNYHMDLIAGLANMRAGNYSIPEVDKLMAKFIAGRIIPAIATSTAMATGLVCLELYKVLIGDHRIEDYRNTFANLALPLFSIAEPAGSSQGDQAPRHELDCVGHVDCER